MSYFLSPVFNEATFNDNGAPGSGWTLTTDLAGTATPVTVYMDSLGAADHQQPITLNARGEPPAPIWILGGQSVKFILKDADGVTIRTIDNVTGINDSTDLSPDEWQEFGDAPTYISATQFSLVGDQTLIFSVGRRVKSTITAGTGYHTITASSFGSGVTTVTVNGTALDSGLSAVSYGLLAPSNTSVPGVSITNGVWSFEKAVNEAQGADIASAATVNLTSATGNLVDVTGTVTITAITLAQGASRTVRFTGILTLTHGASLVLPNAANIVTGAGDFAIFRGYAAGVVRCVMYQKQTLYKGPTRQVFVSSSGTYTTPARCVSINIRCRGGGGGGAGSGSGSPGAGVAGGNTTFSTLTASGGAGGSGSTGGAGGAASGGDINIVGAPGGGSAAASIDQIGGKGGGGGGGPGGQVSAAGGIGATNTGGGGGGGGCGSTPPAGPGGGEGGWVEHRINAPAGTYSYGVGAAGTGGAAGTSGAAGGAAGSGIIIVDEWY